MKVAARLPLFLGVWLCLPGAGITAAQAAALPPELAKNVVQSVDADTPRLIAIFKDLHQNPELGFQEQRTAGIVAKELNALWDVGKLQRTAQLREHTSDVSSVAFSPDGKILASGSYDNTIILWDVDTGKVLDQPREQSSYVSSIAFSPDGRILVSAGGDQAVNVWNVDTFQLIGQLSTGTSGYISSVVISSDGQILASANSDYTISLWDLTSLEPMGVLKGHTSFINTIAFMPDSRILASGSYDNSIILWDVESLLSIGTLPGTSGFVSIAFSPDGRTLASGSSDNNITLWEIDRYNSIGHALRGSGNFVNSVAFSPDGKILASGEDDNSILLWDVNTREPIGQLLGHTGDISSLAFSPDGRLLASGSWDKTVIVWDMKTLKQLHQLTGHEGEISGIAFSPDGRSIAAGSYDGTILLWDMEDPQNPVEFGNTDLVYIITFSPDGLRLFSAGCREIRGDAGCVSGDITVWDTLTQHPITRLAGHTSDVSSLAFSPDGGFLASGSYDNTIILWDMDHKNINISLTIPDGCPSPGPSTPTEDVSMSVDVLDWYGAVWVPAYSAPKTEHLTDRGHLGTLSAPEIRRPWNDRGAAGPPC